MVRLNGLEIGIRRLELAGEVRSVLEEYCHVLPALAERVHDLVEFSKKLHKNAIVIIAERNDIVGFAAFYANDFQSGIAYLSLIAVRPSEHGRGIGRSLLDTCVEMSKRGGMSTLKLEVHKHNLGAIRFYEKSGFSFLGPASQQSVYMVRGLDFEPGGDDSGRVDSSNQVVYAKS